MRTFRVVYEYAEPTGRVHGSGACFVDAESETQARAIFEKTWPDGTIVNITEEAPDPLAIYKPDGSVK